MKKLRIITYRDLAPDGGELVSEYGPGWQRAYHLPKGQLDFWKKQAKKRPKGSSNE